LLDPSGDTPVATSIDPYFFRVPSGRESFAPKPVAYAASTAGASIWPWLIAGLLFIFAGLAITSALSSRVEQDLQKQANLARSNVEEEFNRIIDERVRGPVLANYRGFVAVSFLDVNQRVVKECAPGYKGSLEVRFEPEPPSEIKTDLIDFHAGEDRPRVGLRVVVDTGEFRVTPQEQDVDVAPGINAKVQFEVVAPAEEDSYRLFVQVFQKSRLLQVATLELRVTSAGTA
jgi:hypothetical protein